MRALIAESAPNVHDISEIEELSSDLMEQTKVVITQLKELIGSDTLSLLAARRGNYVDELNRVERKLEDIEGVYAEFASIRDMLDKAIVEESNVQYRLIHDLPGLRDSVKKITHELLYIKEERQKLKLKLRKEYPNLPLAELLEVTETPNAAWTGLAGNIRLASVSI